MTSRLRRKPPITAWSIRSTKTSGGLRRRLPLGRLPAVCLAAALAVSWSASSLTTVAQAEDNGVVNAAYVSGPADSTYVRTVAYTSGEEAKPKLNWMPVRPTKDQVGPNQVLKVAQRQPTRAPAEPIPPGEPVSPFSDPFGDSMDLSQVAPPAGLPGDQMLERQSSPPPLQESLPDLLDAQSSEQSQPIQVPSLEEALAAGPGVEAGECPTPQDLKRIESITSDIQPTDGRFPRECGIDTVSFQTRAWAPTTFNWKASGLCHKPLYFEDPQLERYGHSWGPYLQPVMSGAHFFLNVPILPYKMGLYPPGECMYSLGYYRPGNCAPYMIDPFPISVRAALAEAGVWVGLGAAIP